MEIALKAEFAAALLQVAERRRPPASGFGPAPTSRSASAVYRNNVVAGLVQCLGERFPVVEAACRRGILPCHGAGLRRRRAAALAAVCSATATAFRISSSGFAPAAGVPFLADVARLELHCAAGPTTPRIANRCRSALSRLLPATDALAVTGARLHPSVRLLTSPYPGRRRSGGRTRTAAIRMLASWQAEAALVAAAGARRRGASPAAGRPCVPGGDGAGGKLAGAARSRRRRLVG